MKYDLIINVHPKDTIKLKHCIESINSNFSLLPENKYIVSPKNIQVDGFITVSDEDALPICKESINNARPNWIFQQLVKLGQDFTKNDLYLAVDSDVIFNNKIDIGKYFYISSRDQHHVPYFNLMKIMGIEKRVNYSFINDFMMFDRKACKEIINGSIKDFASWLNEHMSDDCYLSEFELYGNFISNKYPGMYKEKFLNVETFGKYVPYQTWTEKEIEDLKRAMKQHAHIIDLFTIHSWT